jgi:serine/threonine protein kinase
MIGLMHGNPIDLEGHGQRYRLLRHIGRGGFGDVYMAQATTHGGITRTVAIKLLRESVAADDMLAKRLRDEARVLGMLDHRNIVRAEDLLVVDGRPALVMEYVPGANLDWLINPQSNPAPLPPEVLLDIAQQVANALDAAWSRPSQLTGKPLNLLHRDIKPSNIRITPEGMVKVLDFGISRPQPIEREAQTQRMPPGSRHYAAPEMILGLAHGPQVDIYALGATLYESMARERLGMAQNRAAAHDLYVEERLDKLELVAWSSRANTLRRLLASMLCHDMEGRPTAQHLRKQCSEMRASFTGIGLQHWAPQVVPNVVRICSSEADGPLSGTEAHSERSLEAEITTHLDVDNKRVRVEETATEHVAESKPVTVETPRSHRSGLLIASLAAAVLTGGLLWWWFQGLSPKKKPWFPIPPSPQEVIDVETTPAVPATPEILQPPPSAPSMKTASPPEPSPFPAPVARVEPIEVVIVSNPMGIGVSIDHIPIGTTPLRTPLAPGTYELTFHAKSRFTQKIQVAPEGRNRWLFDQSIQSIR